MKLDSCLRPLAYLLVISLLFANCKKGDVGPAGPTGPAGPSGSQGLKGDTGTANVIYSGWLDVAYQPDTIHIGTAIDTIGFYGNITATKLTNAILSGGELKVYMNAGTSANPDVFILPYLDPYSGIHVTPEFFVQRIYLYSNANVSTVTQNALKYLQYRYILIPGGVNARMAHPVDWSDYNKVKIYLGLKD
jgi:hypothetical protein